MHTLRFIELPVEIVKPLKDIDGLEEDTVTFTLELSKPDRQDGQWTFNGEPIVPSEHYTISFDGCVHTITIRNLTMSDQGLFKYSIENISTEATLFVSGKHR